MEVFFLIFQKFFRLPASEAGGGGEQAEQSPEPVRQPQQGGQDQPAEGEEVQPAPQSHGGHVVNADLPVVPEQGEGEQPRRGPHPEQQVQQKGQPGQPPIPAQGAHAVVDQAKRRPQQEALAENGRLVQNIRGHGSAQ